MTKINYRPDIDGLRAIAVLSVVFYHFGIGPLQGGFVGVDIFFVISGYLITGIIQKEIEAGNFTFSGFYERRVRRIFPALFAMLLATLALGVLVLLPSDLTRLGNATLATLLFGSNVLFWRQSGYFDASSEYNPLLHTWSLAVEEQFYIGFPILLILVHRHARWALNPILIVCAIVSLALCIWAQALRPSATFFLSPFRAWELLVGSLCAIGALPALSNRMLREALAAAAIVIMLGSLWWTRAGVNFPGWQAVFPVFATAILLHVGGYAATRVHRMLAWQPMVWISLVSYSLYIWHWPLLVYAHYQNGMEPLPTGLKYFLLMIAFILAWISYHLVETPFRRRKAENISNLHRPTFAAAAGAMAIIGGLAFLAKADGGWEGRFSPDVVKFDRARTPNIPYQICDGRAIAVDQINCAVGHRSSQKKILLWGDSHALAWAPAFETFSGENKALGILAVNSACPPLLDVSNPVNRACKMANEQVFKWIKSEQPDQVYLVASWMSYSQPDGQYSLFDNTGNKGNALVFSPAMRRTIESLRPFVRQIILIGPTPGAPGDAPFKLALSKLKAVAPPAPKTKVEFLSQSKWFWQEANRYKGDRQVVLIDPAVWFCDGNSCRYQEGNGELLYRDGGHLNLAGARYVERHFPAQILLTNRLAEEDINRASR